MKRSNVHKFLALFAVSYAGLTVILHSAYSGSSFQVQIADSPVDHQLKEQLHQEIRLTPWEHIMQQAHVYASNRGHLHRNCKYLYGAEHIGAYRDQTELCSGGSTTVKCSRFEDTHPDSDKDEFGEALCEATNIIIDYKRLLRWGDEKEEKFLNLKKQSKDIDTNWWATESLAGTLRGSCNEAEHRVKNWTSGRGGQAFLRNSFVSEPVDRDASAASVVDKHQECKFGLKHTLYVIGDKWSVKDNLWHNIEEIMSMFVGTIHEF